TGGTLRTFLGNGDCTFTGDVVETLAAAPQNVGTLVLDADTKEDVVMLVDTSTPTLAALLSTTGQIESITAGATAPGGIVVANVDINPLADVLFTVIDTRKVVIRHNQGGSFGGASQA